MLCDYLTIVGFLTKTGGSYQLTAESAKKVTIPKQLDSYLPGAKLSVSLDEEPTPTASRRIHIDLTWNGADGQAVAPVRLTSWVFPERSRSD